MHVLNERQEALLARERTLLERLEGFLKDFGAPREDAELARQASADLEELFLLVVVGEFNSGKSAFINALLGADVSTEGVTPTTDRITLLRHAPEPVERERRGGVIERGHPNDFLREVAIVDTPGTNAIIRHHEELSRGFVPRSDLVLFVTSAERPLTESERGYLELIRDWGKKVLLVVNKVDLLREEEHVRKVRSFVESGIRSMLNMTPPLFFVSSLLARKAKDAGTDLERNALLAASGFAELESFVRGLLDEEGRVKLKLQSPLGIVEQVVERYVAAVEERVRLLEDDFKMAEYVEAQLELYGEDMRRDFEARVAEVENVVYGMSERGDAWLERNIRITNVRELMQRDRIEDRFRREVAADTEEMVNERVGEIVDWIVERNHRQWRAVAEYVSRRRQAQYDEHLIGEVGDGFEYNRSQVLASVGKDAASVVGSYDRERESQDLALSVQGALTRTLALEVGAIGIGAVVVALATTRFLDATGIIAAAIIAGYGLFILPNRRRRARQDFHEKTEALRERLGDVLRRQFDSELAQSIERMREALAPYTRFVRTEHARMTDAKGTLAELQQETDSLRAEIH